MMFSITINARRPIGEPLGVKLPPIYASSRMASPAAAI
jgi:hypothetical protein